MKSSVVVCDQLNMSSFVFGLLSGTPGLRMRMLKEGFASLSEMQRTQIKEWVRQQVSQNNFNCTLKPRPKPNRARPTPAGGKNNNNINHNHNINTINNNNC